MFYAFLAPIGYGIGNSLNKITGNAVGYIRSAILLSFWSGLFIFILTLYLDTYQFNFSWFIITLFFGMYGYLPLVFFIKSISCGKVGVVVPIVDLSIIFPILLSFLFLNQTLTSVSLIFILVLLFGVALMSFNFSEFHKSDILNINSGILFSLIASVMWGVGYFFWSFSVKEIGPYQTSLFIEIGVLLAALIHLLIINKEKLFGTIPIKVFLTGMLIGAFATLGDLGTNLGIQNVGVALTMAITGARPAVGTLTGFFVFKEKLSIKQYLSILLIIVGVVGVSLFK